MSEIGVFLISSSLCLIINYILVKYKNISAAVNRNEKKFFDYLRKKNKLKSLKFNHVLFSVVNFISIGLISFKIFKNNNANKYTT